MNIKQVKKHGEVIKWFIDNPEKGVWRKVISTNSWYITNDPNWHEDYIYIQNDEYSDLRKAQADGKQLQLFNNNYTTNLKNQTWNDETIIHTHIPIERYRIKPDEPNFKVGDWVVAGSSRPSIYTESMQDLTMLTPWEPINGEWCVFWDNNNDINTMYQISKFEEKIKNLYRTNAQFSDEYFEYENIAPLEFAQTLKDK